GCRVPLPWAGTEPPYGFSPDGVQPWLPQPATWNELTVEAELADPGSMLSLYRGVLRLRHDIEGLAGAGLAWRDSVDGVLDFDRGESLRCVVNLSGQPVPLDEARVLISSSPLADGALPTDAAAWLSQD
ncbi:MAG: DUF3459 domain-containing protein, partial [Pedococcus sp.]